MVDSDASLTEGERAFLRSLDELGVRYLLVGMSAALLQGARGATEDLELWFENLADLRIGKAAIQAGGFFVTRAEPPMLGGMSERFDIVTHMSGLPDFSSEYANAKSFEIDGVRVRALPLARILLSKRAADRTKDQAVLHSLTTALKVIEALDNDVVSLWIGRATSRAALEAALTVSFSSDGDFLGSPFSNAFAVGYYDEGLQEAEYVAQPTRLLGVLLKGASYGESVIPRFEALGSLAIEAQCAVLLYNYRHHGPTEWHQENVSLRFFGTVTYR